MVRYLQLAHNERHSDTGSPVAKVIHSFGTPRVTDTDGWWTAATSTIHLSLAPDRYRMLDGLETPS